MATILLFGGLLFVLPTTYYLLPTHDVLALDVGVAPVEESIALTGTDIRVVIARIINVALGLLGVVAVGFIIYGGFVWMTAAGDEDRVTSAKKILTNAVIGLVIILTSFAITQFVLSRLIEATTGARREIVEGGGGGLGGLPRGAFAVRSISPQNPAPPRGFPKNAVVRIRMNQAVEEASAAVNVRVSETASGIVASGNLTVDGSLIRFAPTGSCAPDPGTNCFEADTTFTVDIDNGLRSTSGRAVTCGGLAPPCRAEFTAGNFIDTEDPLVSITVPSSQQSIPPDFQDLRALSSDDAALAEVGFFDGADLIDVDAPVGAAANFEAEAIWETAEIPLNTCRSLTATATDTVENETTSSAVPVVVRPAHCFDGVQDVGETGLDCGGDLEAAAEEYCGLCAGEACDNTPADSCNRFCRSGSCVGGVCLNLPRIDSVSPLSAGPGSYITIEGEFFETSGTVSFLGADGSDDDVPAESAPCAGSWSPIQIIVVVPEDENLATGPLEVTTAQGSDTTADARGFVGNFVPTDALLPGLCSVRPQSGGVDTSFTVTGTGFGEEQADSGLTVGDREVTVVTAWSAEEISGRVPVVAAGPRDVRVRISGEFSNPRTFTVLGPEAGTEPVITSVTPAEGPPGTYITIFGANFGTIGQVIFRNPISGATAIGDTNFPEQCEGGFWQQTQITVKVPRAYLSGAPPGTAPEEIAHDLVVRRSGASEASSAAAPFTVTGGSPAPGLCGLNPVSGPEGVLVRFFGEGFGGVSNTIARFFDDIESAATFAADNEVRALVPGGARTGPVRVEVREAAAPSNPRNFQVVDCRERAAVCEPGFECCANGACAIEGQCAGQMAEGAYAWYFSTGRIPQIPRLVFGCSEEEQPPSPAPWRSRSGGNSVCVNAAVTGRFTIAMDASTITNDTVSLHLCTPATRDAPESCAAEAQPAEVIPVLWNDGRGGFELDPDVLLPSTNYEVRLGTGIRGAEATGGVALAENPDCGPGIAYCWRFRTRDNSATCEVQSLHVVPGEMTAMEAGEKIVYGALPRGDDMCVMLDGDDFAYSWSATEPDGRATLAVGIPEGMAGFAPTDREDRATVTAQVETPRGNPVDVRAEIMGQSVSDIGLLTIDFTEPEVVEFAPNCQQACINAGIYLRFNTDMRRAAGEPGSVLEDGALLVRRCANESCLSFLEDVPMRNIRLNEVAEDDDLTLPGRVLRADPPESNFAPDAFYRVILSGSVQSSSGVALTGENYGPDFSRIFRTKDDPAACGIHTVEVVPPEGRVSVVGARLPYAAIPRGSPDECSARGQELTARDYNWGWSVEDRRVADLLIAGRPLDTTIALPSYCSSACLNTGAAGVSGQTAVCGDGNVQSNLGEECDDGGTTNGDGCSNICLNEGAVGAAICGNGRACVPSVFGYCAESGLECSDAAPCADGSACEPICPGASTCSSVSLTCVENGESCDDGNTLSGDGCSSRCLPEGAGNYGAAGSSVCGNGSVGIGESCDDGNRTSGDGCSSSCLLEGSRPGPFALCGNGIVENDLGEECDGGPNCDSRSCLNLGTPACVSGGVAPCCGGGGAPEAGEDCDDGNIENGDGCSSRCLNEGSSYRYAQPSFCGDGIRQTGEECEASAPGDSRIDPRQVAEAVGAGPVSNGRQTTEITASADGVSDEASFMLQCGFSSDRQCRNPVTNNPAPYWYGVGSDSCCYLRPYIMLVAPRWNERNVCRNPLIRVDFNQRMEVGSFTGNVRLARGIPGAGAVCGEGQEEMTRTRPESGPGLPVGGSSAGARAKFFGKLFEEMTDLIIRPVRQVLAAHAPPWPPFFQPTFPGAWCLGEVTGRVTGVHNAGNPDTPLDDRTSLFFVVTSGALLPEEWYVVRLEGEDALGDEVVHGIRSANGVGLAADRDWWFHTGSDICDVDQVLVEDAVEAEGLPAGLFTEAGEEHPFLATALTFTDAGPQSIVPVAGVYDWDWSGWTSSNEEIVTVFDAASADPNPNTATVAAENKNGSAVVGARLKITADTLSLESTVDRVVRGASRVTVNLCENPGLTIEDMVGNDDGLVEPFGNFSTSYCRDAGDPGTAGDLPLMSLQTVAAPSGQVLKEFFLQSAGEVIGFRMLPNPNHLSAARWYRARGFGGGPRALTVDGYDAVRDGRTVYVNSSNLGDDGNLYSNIYVISHNEGARPETLAIYNQLLENIQFNVNLPETENLGVCVPEGEGEAASCSSDLDCGAPASCSAQKEKIRRDTRRLADLRDIEEVLGSRCSGGSCAYPRLSAGTLVRSMSVSAWPSWLETLSAELGAILPADPLNRFADCAEGYDENTCFAALSAAGCPAGNCYQCAVGSRVYQYTNTGPSSYRLETDLEYTANPWSPTLAALGSSLGATVSTSPDSPPICSGQVVGAENVCGDGIVGPAEECEPGETTYRSCTFRREGRMVTGQIQLACTSGCTFDLAPGAQCQTECGDGVRQAHEFCDDGANNGRYGFCDATCSGRSAYCGDSALAGTEECDLGVNNGQWNRQSGTAAAPLSCSWDCRFPGPFCGDGEVNGAEEQCDGDVESGRGVCSNDTLRPCNTDGDCPAGGVCRYFCPTIKRCSSGDTDVSCMSDRSETPDINEDACIALNEGICTDYPQEYRRICNASGGADACTWQLHTGCEVAVGVYCGNGVVEGGEECDDDNENDNDACTNVCRRNVCGDGLLWEGVERCDFGEENGTPCAAPYGGTCNYCSSTCTFVAQTGPFCGDGTVSPSELCDDSADPIIRATCSNNFSISCATLAGVQDCEAGGGVCGQRGFVPNDPLGRGDRSLCSSTCSTLCPPTFRRTNARFQNTVSPNQPDSFTFERSEADVAELAVPACRIGGGPQFDVSIGSDVIHFPSPLNILLVMDNSGSLGPDQLDNIKRALCGQGQPGCAAIDEDGAIARLYDSRAAGNVRIGLVEFGGTSRYRTWYFGNQRNQQERDEDEADRPCESNDPVPCYDRPKYLGPDRERGTADDVEPQPTAGGAGGVSAPFSSGFLPDSATNRDNLRAIVAGLGGQNTGTRTYLALRQTKTIMDASSAGSKVIILMSDGISTDCCSGDFDRCSTGVERTHCSETASCVGPSLVCNTGFEQVQDLQCENITCADVTELRCVGGPDHTRSCRRDSDCRQGPGDAASCDEVPSGCCSTGPISCTVTSGALNDCQFSDVEASRMNQIDDGIYIFTVSFARSILAPMERWADTDPGNQIYFSYSGSSISDMLNEILSNIGVRLQISNQDDFSEAGSWIDEIIIPESGFGLRLDTPTLNSTCTNSWRSVFLRVIYGGRGPNAQVTLSTPRWNFCPLAEF